MPAHPLRRFILIVGALGIFGAACATESRPPAPFSAAIDRDLLDVTVPQLHKLYSDKKYTVTQVVQWHLDRIDRYNGVYGAIETVLRTSALAEAARQDAAAANGATPAPLWGVPIVIKANTSIKGEVTTAGWEGFAQAGHEMIAPQDATIVARFKAAGAIIVGIANMPDLANSDTNRSSSYGRTGNAYDVRFSPGGSSGGVVTAVVANMAVLGNGTDTGNSIRMPAATSALVGVYPTRGLVSIAGIAPLDWLLDNTGPIARNATDAAIALSVMAGTEPDPLDPKTTEAPANARPVRYQSNLKADALKGKRFGVPAFILTGDGIPFHGIPSNVPEPAFEKLRTAANMALRPETRAAFMKAVDALRAAGAEVVVDDSILPLSFAKLATRVSTYGYMQDGTDRFLASFGPPEYHSAAEYLKAVGKPLFTSSIGTEDVFRKLGNIRIDQRVLEKDPDAERTYHAPRRAMLAAYLETLDRLKLDGLVYPAIQMPPPDETMPQDGRVSEGPALGHELGQHDWRSRGRRPRGLLRERTALRPGVLRASVD
jgi:Asp-tRNA(Asn)/Glu-tRNA(Gln) amidotransferase A subunit family amidase